MSTVLLRLAGPVQSWGNRARGPSKAHRHTHTRPTKSGVIGLVANALGRHRADDIADLAALRFGVRTDLPGRLESDYHTTGSGDFPILPGDLYTHPVWAPTLRRYHPSQARGFAPYTALSEVATADDGTVTAAQGLTIITQDWYLADASFLAALSGPDTLIAEAAGALAAPARPLYLGRRANIPSAPILAGTVGGEDLAATLAAADRDERAGDGPLPMWIEPSTAEPGAVAVHDQPISYRGATAPAARLEHRTWTPPAEHDATDFFSPDPELNTKELP